MTAVLDGERRSDRGASPVHPRRLLPAEARAGLTLAAALLTAGCGAPGGAGGAGGECAAPARKGLSGYCVPRWVSLKRGQVFARKGPGPDYGTLWIYRVRGLPVQVVAETTDWRRICDPQGGAAWVHRSMIDGRRTVLTTGAAPLPLARAASDAAVKLGMINDRAIASLDRCAGDWCKVKVGGLSGWLPAAKLWGVAESAQCR